jgi:dUTP pyrophosphatase
MAGSAPLRVSFLSEFATLPARGSDLAAGYDLSAAHDTTIAAGGKGIVKTDLAMACPPGTYGRIAPRSGLAWKKHIDVGAGVIDGDYRGNVGVVLFNHGKEDLCVKRGDRVAQLVLECIKTPPVVKVASLEDTDRGAGGFGSTGVSQPLQENKRQRTDNTE